MIFVLCVAYHVSISLAISLYSDGFAIKQTPNLIESQSFPKNVPDINILEKKS